MQEHNDHAGQIMLFSHVRRKPLLRRRSFELAPRAQESLGGSARCLGSVLTEAEIHRYSLKELSMTLLTEPASTQVRRIRLWIAVFMAGLILSGVTAFPLQSEVHVLSDLLHKDPLLGISLATGLLPWVMKVKDALDATNRQFPFLAYGTDWLAFAHLVLALVFLGPYREPVRNRWVIDFGLMACAAVPFLALIAGPLRGIPFGWRLIDCSFGVLGALPLLRCRSLVNQLERELPPNAM